MEDSSASEDTDVMAPKAVASEAVAPDAVAPDVVAPDVDEQDQSRHFRTVSFYLFY